MSDTTRAAYERKWSPREYLRQYYSTDLTGDDRANAAFAARELRALGRRYPRALEFGCGPTVHHAAMLAPFVDALTLSDYLEANLDEVRLWLRDAPEAFDWDVWLRGMLAMESAARGASEERTLAERKALLRRVAGSPKRGDVFQPHPLGDGSDYDLVASYYCIECVGTDRSAWAQCLGRLCGLVRPGGVLILGSIREGSHYHVFDQVFPLARIDDGDFETELARHGFPPSGQRVEVAQVPEFAEQGFSSVYCVRAVKSA